MSSVCSSPISVQPLTLLVDCWLKSEEFPKQMAISSAQNSSDKSLFLRKLTGFVPQLWIFDRTLSCFVCSSLHLCLSSSVAQFQSVPLRPPSNFFIHSLSIPVLSETQLQKAFSPNAGAFSLGHSLPQNAYGMMRVSRTEWPVPQLTGVYSVVRVPRNLDCTLLPWRSLLPCSRKVLRLPKFSCRW